MAFEIIVIGGSMGGFHALQMVLSGLPKDFSLPVVIVQHRHPDAGDTLVMLLQRHSALPVDEAESQERLVPGHVYIAPADYHLLVGEGHLALSTEAPVSYSRPSIDVLFDSASFAYRDKVIGVLLSGANRDGADGVAQIKARGGVVVVQEPTTAENPIMPEAGIAAADIDEILPLSAIAPFLVNLVAENRGESYAV